MVTGDGIVARCFSHCGCCEHCAISQNPSIPLSRCSPLPARISFSRWSTIDVDSLAFEIERKNREIKKLQAAEQKFNKRNELFENRRDRVR